MPRSSIARSWNSVASVSNGRRATAPRESGSARTLIKCGLHHEAIRELTLAAADERVRPQAIHEMAVASLRAGRVADAMRWASDALRLDTTNQRARLLLWLGAEKSSRYPPEIPPEMRMQVRSGRHPTVLTLEDVAVRVGLDKTSAGRGTAIFDYNNDGYLDVLIAAAHGGGNLYRNNGDGTFTDESIESRLDNCQTSFITPWRLQQRRTPGPVHHAPRLLRRRGPPSAATTATAPSPTSPTRPA